MNYPSTTTKLNLVLKNWKHHYLWNPTTDSKKRISIFRKWTKSLWYRPHRGLDSLQSIYHTL